MEWVQFLILMIALLGFLITSWRDSRTLNDKLAASDAKYNTQMNELRKEANEIKTELAKEANSIRKDMTTIFSAIEKDFRDFHGRMSKLEERYIQFKMNENKK